MWLWPWTIQSMYQWWHFDIHALLVRLCKMCVCVCVCCICGIACGVEFCRRGWGEVWYFLSLVMSHDWLVSCCVIFQGMPFEKAKDIRSSNVNPAIFVYYKHPVFMWKVTVIKTRNVLSSRNRNLELQKSYWSVHLFNPCWHTRCSFV